MTVAETLQQDAAPPIVIHDGPLPDQGWAFFRQMLPLITGFLVVRGYIEGDLEQIISLALGVGLPIVWGQLKTRLRAKQLVTAERHAPDDVITTKSKAKGVET